jgi:MFS family permease
VNRRAATTTSDSALRGIWLVPFFANTVLVQAVTFVLRPTAIYRALELDVPTQWLGALGASFAIVPLILAVPSGMAADRWGERRVMVFGGILTLVAAGCFVFAAQSVWGVLAASVVLGTGHLCSVVGQQSMVANHTPSHRYDSAFGHYTFAASAGQAIGPALIVMFGGSARIPDTQTIFEWATGLGVILVGASLLLPSTRATATPTAAAAGSVRQLLHRPGLVPALTVSCIVLSAVDISLVYLPALGAEQDIAAGTIGVLLAVRAGASMVSRLFLGRLVALVGRRTLLTTSVGAAALGMALLPVPMALWLLVLVIAATGLGLGAGQPLTMSWLADSTPPGLRGRAMALRLTGNRFGQVVVPTVAGVLAVGAGATGVLWITAGALAAAGVVSRRVTSPALPNPQPATVGD